LRDKRQAGRLKSGHCFIYGMVGGSGSPDSSLCGESGQESFSGFCSSFLLNILYYFYGKTTESVD
jgi:hypothetical protein